MQNVLEIEKRQTDFMPETQKRNRITFEPDEDVAEGLAAMCEAMGNAHGLKTQIINDALRAALSGLRQRVYRNLGELEKKGKRAA